MLFRHQEDSSELYYFLVLSLKLVYIQCVLCKWSSIYMVWFTILRLYDSVKLICIHWKLYSKLWIWVFSCANATQYNSPSQYWAALTTCQPRITRINTGYSVTFGKWDILNVFPGDIFQLLMVFWDICNLNLLVHSLSQIYTFFASILNQFFGKTSGII